MAFKVATAGATIPDARKGGFAPLPAGPIGVTIFKAEVGEYGPRSANAGKPNLKVQLRVQDGQAGANRRLFDTIPLFPQWAPSAKNPDGSDAFAFFQFFAAVRGETEQEFRDFIKSSPDDFEFDVADLIGKPLTAVLTIEADTYAFDKAKVAGTLEDGETQEDYKTNRVGRYKKYEGLASGEAASEAVAATKTYTL